MPHRTSPGSEAVPFGIDGQVADDADAFAGRGVLDGDPGRAHGEDLADGWSVQPCHRAARAAEEDVGDRGVLAGVGALVDVEHDLPGGARLYPVEVAQGHDGPQVRTGRYRRRGRRGCARTACRSTPRSWRVRRACRPRCGTGRSPRSCTPRSRSPGRASPPPSRALLRPSQPRPSRRCAGAAGRGRQPRSTNIAVQATAAARRGSDQSRTSPSGARLRPVDSSSAWVVRRAG